MDQQVGHNSVSKDQLRVIVERIERLEEDKKTISSDVRDIYKEADGNGFDVKTADFAGGNFDFANRQGGQG